MVTGVKQRCCMSGFLFLMVIDWVMRKTVDGQRTGRIRWDFTTLLEDIDYADDLLLLSSRVDHMQEKTARLEEKAGRVGLKLNPQKCKWMKVNSRNNEGLRVRESMAEEVDSFTYLGAQMTKDGGGTLDIKMRTALAYASFNRLNKVWNAGDISKKTKTTLFKTLVLSVLLYGCETWKMTKEEEKKLDIFQTKRLRRIYRIRWQQHVTNKEVLEMAGADAISEEVRMKRWYWIGHVLRKEVNNDCAVALGRKPEEERNRGRPNTTWRCTVEKERDRQGWKMPYISCSMF